MSGDRKEQYQNLRKLSLAPKTRETYEQIIFAYINGAAEFFIDLSVLCSSLERRDAHPNSKEYTDYEFINSVRHANSPERYDVYVNELGWCLKKIGCTAFGMGEESFNDLKYKVLSSIVKRQNPETLTKALQRLGMASLPGMAELGTQVKQTECDLVFDLFSAVPNTETLNLMLGMYDGVVVQVMIAEKQLKEFDISGLDFDDSRIDEIIDLAINAAEARAKAKEIKELLICKFGLAAVESYIRKIESKNQSELVGISR